MEASAAIGRRGDSGMNGLINPEKFAKELQAQHPELLSDWNRTKRSLRAKSLILELHRVYGYEAARVALMAATAQADGVTK